MRRSVGRFAATPVGAAATLAIGGAGFSMTAPGAASRALSNAEHASSYPFCSASFSRVPIARSAVRRSSCVCRSCSVLRTLVISCASWSCCASDTVCPSPPDSSLALVIVSTWLRRDAISDRRSLFACRIVCISLRLGIKSTSSGRFSCSAATKSHTTPPMLTLQSSRKWKSVTRCPLITTPFVEPLSRRR